MKSLKALMILVLATLFAIPALAQPGGGNSNGPSSNDSQAIAGAAAGAIAGAVSGSSSRTSVFVGGSKVIVGGTNVTTGDAKAYGGSSRAYGGSSKAKGGDSGGNVITTTNTTNEAEIPVASAIAGIATECVNVLAAQGMDGGFSLGGVSSECQAAIVSKQFFSNAVAFAESDPDKAAEYLELGHKYALLAAPGRFELAMKNTSESMIDISIILGLGKLLVGAF